MATKSISQLDSAVSLALGDLFEIAEPDAQSQTGYASKKISMSQAAKYVQEDVSNASLNTTNKTLVGAINEVDGLINVGGLVGTSSAITSGNTWHKVASIEIDAADNSAKTICFLVIDTAYNTNACILNCQLRVISTGIEVADLKMIANNNFSTDEFRLYANVGASSYTFEIWTSVARRYKYRRFLVLNQGDRTFFYTKAFTIYNSSSASAAPSESATCIKYDCLPDNYVNQSEVATVENGNTASQAYTIGDYMFWKGGFYKVTAAISSGGAITEGTNVTQTTIGSELKAALNS